MATGIDPADPRVRAEQFAMVVRNLPVAKGCVLAVTMLSIALIWPIAGGPALGWWTGSFCAFVALSTLIVPLFRRDSRRAEHTRLWGWVLILNGFVSGVFLLAFGLLTFAQEHLVASLYVSVILTGLTAGSLAAFSAYAPVHIAFSVPALGGVIVPFAFAGQTSVAVGVATVSAIFLAGTIMTSRNTERMLVKSIRLGFDNQALIDALTREKTRAEEANIAKSRFLAYASHDLRQPLHAQQLFLSVIGDRNSPQEVAAILDKIRGCSQALSDMLDALLDISRIESGVLTPALKPLRLQAFLEMAEREFAAQAAAKGLRLRIVPTSLVAFTDALMLDRILRNLVSNALRYTERGGVVVGCRRQGSSILLQVADSGIGIPEEQRETIFREFHQIGNSARDHRLGLGLGLAIVEGLTRTLGTSVTVRSVVGRGSVFSLRLTRGRIPALKRPTPSGAPAAVGLKGATVLVIEDNETIRDAMNVLLARWGCRPVLVPSAEDWLGDAEGRAGPPDLILADYRLAGGETGPDAVGRIREACGWPVPALIITGETAPESLREVTAHGFPIVHKPLNPQRLRTALATLLRTSHLAAHPRRA